MWGNYLTLGQSLMKHSTYAFVDTFGLALGLSACLLLLLYVRYETSYHTGLPEADHVYAVQSANTDPETGRVAVNLCTNGLLALAVAIGTVSRHAIRVVRTNPIHALR